VTYLSASCHDNRASEITNVGVKLPDVVLKRGGDLAFTLDVDDGCDSVADLTGVVIKAEVAKQAGGDVIADLSTYFTIRDNVSGRIYFHLPAIDSLALPIIRGYWDVLLKWPQGAASWAGYGAFNIVEETTHYGT
jgi:hypothetical protein